MPEPEPITFKLAHWNVLGANYGDREGGEWVWEKRGDRVGKRLAEFDAQLVTLNENSANRMTEVFSRWLPAPFRHHGSTGNNDIFHDPVLRVLEREEFSLGDYQKRTLHRITFELVGKKFHVVNTHMPVLDVPERERQARAAAKYIDKLKGDVVLTGDLNNHKSYEGSPRETFEKIGIVFMREQVKVLNGKEAGHVKIGEAPQPGRWLCDIGTRGASIVQGTLEMMPAHASDHRPLTALIQLS